jgi:hypothetical protein
MLPQVKAQCKEQMIHSLRTELQGCPLADEGFFKLLETLTFAESVRLYKGANNSLCDKNGYVVSHSPTVSYVTGSHNNAVPVGCSEQVKATVFYLGPYFLKEKFSREECLTILAKVHEHNVRLLRRFLACQWRCGAIPL